MRKLPFFLLFIVLMSHSAVAQTDWPELQSMKTVMKQTFPPLIKENKLQPARSNAAALYERAVALENATKPKPFNKKKMAVYFQKITELSAALKADAAAEAADDVIKADLVNLHAAFAEVAHHPSLGNHNGH